MLKYLLLLTLSLTIGSYAKANNCADCDSAKKMTSELHALNYTNADERAKGNQRAEATADQLAGFRKLKTSDPNRIELFKSLLNLAREASPYDDEGQIAELLARILVGDAKLRKIYTNYIQSLPKSSSVELCKSKDIEKTVTEQMCYIAAGVKGQDTSDPKTDEKVKACISKFSFDDCLKAGK